MDLERSRLKSATRLAKVAAMTSGFPRGDGPACSSLARPLFKGTSLPGPEIRHSAMEVSRDHLYPRRIAPR